MANRVMAVYVESLWNLFFADKRYMATQFPVNPAAKITEVKTKTAQWYSSLKPHVIVCKFSEILYLEELVVVILSCMFDCGLLLALASKSLLDASHVSHIKSTKITHMRNGMLKRLSRHLYKSILTALTRLNCFIYVSRLIEVLLFQIAIQISVHHFQASALDWKKIGCSNRFALCFIRICTPDFVFGSQDTRSCLLYRALIHPKPLDFTYLFLMFK